MPNQRKQYVISSLNKLCMLFNAGAGEFHFLNRVTNKQFNIKFKHANVDPDWSIINVCHTSIEHGSRLFYLRLGRYNFKAKILELRDEVNMGSPNISSLLKSLNFILKGINTGVGFENRVECYYSGHCCRCGRELTDTVSLVDGFGSECKAYQQKKFPVLQLDIFVHY